MLKLKVKLLRFILRLFLNTKGGGDIQYLNVASENGPIRVLKYLPAKPGKHPVHVNLHGGGWTMGLADMDNFWCRRVADETESAVISIDYAKAPEHPFPTAIHQVRDVILSLNDSPDLDVSRFTIGGFSSGGNLAIAYVLYCLQNNLALPVLCLPVYPATDLSIPYSVKLESVSDKAKDKSVPSWMADIFFKSYTSDYENILVSPSLAPTELLSQFPRTVVLNGNLDALHIEADKFANLLAENGVDVVHRLYEDAVHGFTHTEKGQDDYNEKAKEDALQLMIQEIKQAHQSL
jgi:acetyl esterase